MRQGRSRSGAEALVLDASERHSLVTVRSLARHGVVVAALGYRGSSPALHSRGCSASGVIPDPAADSGRFAAAVIRRAQELGARAVITVSDGSIEALRPRRAELERHARLALPGERALQAAIDKRRTLGLASELGIRVPRSVRLAPGADVQAALAEVGLPLMVKPAKSWYVTGSGGFRLAPQPASSENETMRALEAMWAVGAEPIVQEWVPGRREAVSLLRDHGRVKARFAQVAERMYPPQGGSSVLRQSIALPPDSTAAAEQLAGACELDGYCEIEFRRTRDGVPVLMEINPRLSASVEIAVRCGIDFPFLVYQWATGHAVDAAGPYRTGLRMRWLGGDIRRLREVVGGAGGPDAERPAAALARFTLDFLRPSGYDYLGARDPLPAVIAGGAFITGLIRDVFVSRRGGGER